MKQTLVPRNKVARSAQRSGAGRHRSKNKRQDERRALRREVRELKRGL